MAVSAMKAVAKRTQEKAAEVNSKPVEMFVRVKKLKRPGDHYPASCVEIIYVQGNRIVKRQDVTKPDLIEMTITRAEEILEDGEYRPEA